jgi:hypothetical protein
MVIYDLICENSHKFEGWFKNMEEYEEQKEKKLLNCPVCNSNNVDIIVTRCSIKKKSNYNKVNVYEKLQKFLEENFENVEDRFPEEARKIHYGIAEKRNIRGTATAEEEEELRNEGIEFFKIPIPKFDA